jgi:acyl-ACP thioesterase
MWPRFVDIYKIGSDKPAAQIKSNWCMLDAQTRKLKRVPLDVVQRFSS